MYSDSKADAGATAIVGRLSTHHTDFRRSMVVCRGTLVFCHTMETPRVNGFCVYCCEQYMYVR